MLICLHSLIVIDSEQALAAISAGPSGTYVLVRNLRCVAPPHQLSEFAGVLYGRYNLLEIAQPDALFVDFRGLLLRIRVDVNVSTSAEQYALFNGFQGGIRQAQVQVKIAASRHQNGSAVVIQSPLALDVRNATIRLQTSTDRTLNVLGLVAGGSGLSAADLEVILELEALPRPYQYPYVVAVGAEVFSARNVSVSVRGNKILMLYGLSEMALEDAEDVHVRIATTDALSIYALCASAPLRRLAGSSVFIESKQGENMTLVRQLTAGIARIDNCTIQVRTICVGSCYIPTVCAVFLKQGLVNLSRTALDVYAHAESSINLFGIGEAQASGASEVRQFMVAADIYAADFNGQSAVCGVFRQGAQGVFQDISVDIKYYSEASHTILMGFQYTQTQLFALSAFSARLLVNRTGTSMFDVCGVQRICAIPSLVTGATIVQDVFIYMSCSAPDQVQALAGSGVAFESKTLTISRAAIEFRISMALFNLAFGGVAGSATNLSVDMVHVKGSMKLLYTSYARGNCLAAGLITEATGTIFISNVIVDVNLSTIYNATCSSAIASQFGADITIRQFISAGAILQCQVVGTTFPNAQHVEGVYELKGPLKNILTATGVTIVDDAQLAAIRFGDEHWITLLGARNQHLKALPQMQENGFCACNKTPDFGELFAANAPNSCLFAASRLHNLIHPAIGVLDNPFGVCKTASCSSDCSGHGVFENYTCFCATGRAGVLCEIEICTFPQAISAVSGGFQHCWCADGFQYALDEQDGNGEKCWPSCIEPICQLGGVCYVNGSSYSCEFCSPEMEGDDCGRCKDQSTALDDDLECRPRCLSCHGNCWFTEDDCRDPDSCAFVCNRCDDQYALTNKRCYPRCLGCDFGACWFEGECVESVRPECLLQCSACISEHHEMPRCDSCVPGYFFNNPWCFEIQLGFGGEYYVKDGNAIMIGCERGLDMLEGRCRLPCSEKACNNGNDCHYDGWLPGAIFSCISCKVPYTGRQCDGCQDGFIYFEQECYAANLDGNGECFSYNGGLLCVSCHSGYTSSDCSRCDKGYKSVGPECLQICADCPGDCYFLGSGTVKCDSCWQFYALPDCFLCEEHKEMHDGVCSEKVSVPNGEDCYQSYKGTACERCDAGHEGAMCDSCMSGYFFDGTACSAVVEGNWCNATVCLFCNETNVLLGGVCLPRCTSPRCRGNCGMNGSAVKCDSCGSGFVLAASECFPEVLNDNGVCYANGSQVVCQCRGEASGPVCESCAGLEINGTCFKRVTDAKGTCFSSPLDPAAVVCTSCWPQYEMPLCVECSFGHEEDASGECTACRPGFALEGEVCTVECASCTQGQCSHAGTVLSCTPCFEGYTGAECVECAPHFIRYGSYCLRQDSEPGGTEVVLNEPVSYRCEPVRTSFNCSLCAPGCEFAGQCMQRCALLPELCYEEDGTAVCAHPAWCALYDMNQHACLQCFLGDLMLAGECYAPAQSLRASIALARQGALNLPQRYQTAGPALPECYESRKSGAVFCVSCEAGIAPPSCSTCSDGFVPCPCTGDVGLCCCPKAHSNGGLCYTQNDSLRCQFCFNGYALDGSGVCKKQNAPLTPIIALAAVCFILLAAGATAAAVLAKSPLCRRRIQLKMGRFWVNYGVRTVCLALTQLIAAATALQKLLIGDFYGEATVQLAASVPFCAVFIFCLLPGQRHYYINNIRDLPLISAPALARTAGAALHFCLLARVSVLHPSFYELAGLPALFALLCWVNRAPAARGPALLLAALFAFELGALAICAVVDLAGMSSGGVRGPLTVLAAVGLFCCAGGAVDWVLQRYGSLRAAVYLQTAQFVVSSAIFLCAPREHFGAALGPYSFVFCAVTQVVINAASVVIIGCTSVIEYQIGLASTAIWLQIIARAGEIALASQNRVEIAPGRLVLAVVQLVAWIAGLAVLYAFWQRPPALRSREIGIGQPSGVQPLSRYLKRLHAVFVADYRLIKHPTQCLDLRIISEACDIVDGDLVVDQAERILFQR